MNITLKKKYEQLERANEEQAAITYITSHNIKEPLRQVYSSLELLIKAEGRAMSDGGKANLRRMQSSLNRMNLLLDDIVALSSITSPVDEGEPVNLNEILQHARQQLADKIKTNSVDIGSAPLPVVAGYKELLNYLFYYLINNAIRFRRHDMPLTINISSTEESIPAKDAHDTAMRRYIKVSFEDNGTGFNQEDAGRLFLIVDKSPEKYASSGAWLAICRKIMLAHDGFLQVEGWPGRGAAFHCYFPAGQEE